MKDATENQTIVTGFLKSFMSLAIKMATAGLTYLMYVVLSRSMQPMEYGLFAAGFSLATILAIATSMGQQIAILRFWPGAEAKGDKAAAHVALQSGWAITIFSGLGISAVLALGAAAFGIATTGTVQSVTHLMAASLLILPLAMAEYGSSALRAQGSVWTAMTPRDIFWRGGVPLITFMLFYFGIQLSGTAGLALASGLLALLMAAQFGLSRMAGYENGLGLGGLKDYWRQHRKKAGGFLLRRFWIAQRLMSILCWWVCLWGHKVQGFISMPFAPPG